MFNVNFSNTSFL